MLLAAQAWRSCACSALPPHLDERAELGGHAGEPAGAVDRTGGCSEVSLALRSTGVGARSQAIGAVLLQRCKVRSAAFRHFPALPAPQCQATPLANPCCRSPALAAAIRRSSKPQAARSPHPRGLNSLPDLHSRQDGGGGCPANLPNSGGGHQALGHRQGCAPSAAVAAPPPPPPPPLAAHPPPPAARACSPACPHP